MPEEAMLAGLVSVIGGASVLTVLARRFRRTDDLPSLENWALLDRKLKTVWTWLLLGGTIYTAYTFAAVPGLVYSDGASGFFALPYTVIVCPLAFFLLPRLWAVARQHGYVTVADFVHGRYGSPPLALAVALTGILATMPYLALQLLGVRAVLAVGGLYPRGATSDLIMFGLFAVLTVATYRHGLRTPTTLSALKGIAIFCSAFAVTALVLVRLDGPGNMLQRAAHRLAARGASDASLTLAPDQQSAFLTLALGSALALLMYPHVLTAAFAASGTETLRRASVALPAWAGVLGLFGMLGVGALAVGIRPPPGRAEAAVPLLVEHLMSPLLAGLVLGVMTVGALVPAAVMSIAAASLFVRNVYVAYFHPTATPKRQVRVARWLSLTAQLGAVAFVYGARDQTAINLQLLGGIWILQTFPTVTVGLFTRWLHQRALLVGWATGMVTGTGLVVAQGFSSVVPFDLGGHDVEIYTGLAAVLLNVLVAVVLTPTFDRIGAPRGADATALPSRLNLRRSPEKGASSL
ncbi:sodium:solute symporter family protein [Streptomyces chartreusis]|uniref:sodium:solute symporter family protein n=1 Tax=Streptomyces chartreusis TaxID=1969 RepID=UPI0033AB55BB